MPRQPGRPPLDPHDRSVSVHVRVPSQQYDEAYRVAREQRTSVQELIRRGLVRALDGEREDDDGET